MSDIVRHTGPVWVWRGQEKGSWHFVTFDAQAGEALSAIAVMRRLEYGQRRGWGSLKVKAMIGESAWQTSVFPSKEDQGWLLPIKQAIRKSEGIAEGDSVTIELEIL